MAAADPIHITSGSLGVDLFDPQNPDGNAGISIVGDRGFSLRAIWFGVTPAAETCRFGSCQPGDVISADLEGTRFASTATLDGTSYAGGPIQLAFDFDGEEFPLVLPAPGATFFFVTVPFTFSALFSYPGGVETLVGGGTVRVGISGGPNGYGSFGSFYVFDNAAVPEPASMLLLATGLGLVARRVARARRPRRVDPS